MISSLLAVWRGRAAAGRRRAGAAGPTRTPPLRAPSPVWFAGVAIFNIFQHVMRDRTFGLYGTTWGTYQLLHYVWRIRGTGTVPVWIQFFMYIRYRYLYFFVKVSAKSQCCGSGSGRIRNYLQDSDLESLIPDTTSSNF